MGRHRGIRGLLLSLAGLALLGHAPALGDEDDALAWRLAVEAEAEEHWTVVLPDHGFRVRFDGQLALQALEEPGWLWRVEGGPPAQAAASARQLELSRPSGPGESLTTSPAGLTWDLRIDEPARMAQLWMFGTLVPSSTPGRGIELADETGRTVLWLNEPRATDARGEAVATRTRLVPPKRDRGVWLVEIELEALSPAFPVTIEATFAAPAADLALAVEVPRELRTGEPAEYRIGVTNAGPLAAPNVQVDQGPLQGQQVQATSGCLNDPRGWPTCELGRLEVGQSAGYRLLVRGAGCVPDPASSEFAVRSPFADPDPDNGVALLLADLPCEEQAPAGCDDDLDTFAGPQCAGPDCNDGNPNIHPGATEIPADGVDQDCNGGDVCYRDADDDGFRPNATATVTSPDLDCADVGEATGADPTGDCNDNNASIRPGAIEVPANGVDEDCNGGDVCYRDADDDGFRPNATATVTSTDLDCLDVGEATGADPTGDCNDNNPSIRPGAIEVPANGVDEDCNGGDVCYTDVDNDNFGTPTLINSSDLDCFDANEAPQPGDCNDSNQNIYPGAPEVPGDAIDQDCNGGDSCYTDVDNDNFGTPTLINSSDLDCTDTNEAPQPGDCNDSNQNIYPGAPEACNGADDDCDVAIDEGFVAPAGTPSAHLDEIAGSTQLAWAALVPVTGYDIVRGDLALLRSTGGNFTAATTICLANDQPGTSISDGTPATAAGFWYLIRGVNCQAAGSYDSGGSGQQGSRDVEIATSDDACP